MIDKKLILLVEDNQELNDFNSLLLQGEGFDVKAALTLADARALIIEKTPDAIILDIGMPDGDGRDFLRELRKTLNIPVLFLTGYKRDVDILSGYESGCDDYLIKPYTFKVLHAKLSRLMQKTEQLPEKITRGKLELDLLTMTAYIGGEDISLTKKEFTLLLMFLQNEEDTLGTAQIYETIWKDPLGKNSARVDKLVRHLCKKLEGCDYKIEGDKKAGYRVVNS